MVAGFPIPRTELPRIQVHPDDHQVRKAQLARHVETLVHDYEQYIENNRHVDKQRWKSGTSRDHFKLYRERSSYRRRQHHGNSTSVVVDTSTDGESDNDVCVDEERHFSTHMMLVVGEIAGRMENAMYAVVAADQTELAMSDIFLHDDVADCAILQTMEGPRQDDPYHFLGYKWFVRKSPTSSHLIKHRDSVYIESTGLTTTQNGEQVGYHITQSVELLDFPPLRGRHCVRTTQSIRTLFRQRPGVKNVVEVFMMGYVGPAGLIKGHLAKVVVQEIFFNLTKLIACGEVKRLVDMQHDLHGLREERLEQNLHRGESCGLCRHQKKRFGGTIEGCQICGLDACPKCRVSKRMFQSDGILGRFNKIVCCKTCLIVVSNAKKYGRDVRDDADQALPVSPTPTQELLSPSHHSETDDLDLTDFNNSSAVSSLAGSPERENQVNQRILPSLEDLESPPSSPQRPAFNPLASTTTYGSQVIDISGSLAFVNNRNNGTSHLHLPRVEDPVAQDPTLGASSVSVTTTYRSRVIDISGSLGLPNNEPQEMQVFHDEPTPTPPTVPAETVGEPPQRGSSLTASSPSERADMYLQMLELQRMAQNAYDQTRQNQQYLQSPQ